MAWIKTTPEGDAQGEQRTMPAHDRTEERSAGYRLAAAGIVSTLIYIVMFTLPYSLSKLQAARQIDLAVLLAKAGHPEWGLLLAIFVQGALYWYAWRAARHRSANRVEGLVTAARRGRARVRICRPAASIWHCSVALA